MIDKLATGYSQNIEDMDTEYPDSTESQLKALIAQIVQLVVKDGIDQDGVPLTPEKIYEKARGIIISAFNQELQAAGLKDPQAIERLKL